MNGIDSPLYSAVVSTATTGSVAGGRHAGNGRASQLCCDGPDIILTLESEPVNYAVSAACPCCCARAASIIFSQRQQIANKLNKVKRYLNIYNTLIKQFEKVDSRYI